MTYLSTSLVSLMDDSKADGDINTDIPTLVNKILIYEKYAPTTKPE